MASFRTLLALGRISNLPTVWSNCLAGWLLGEGGNWGDFALVCAGGSALYLGGMYLNDAFDAAHDRHHRPERPIPSGAIAAGAVWRIGFFLLATGLVLLALPGWRTLAGGVLLAGAILLYNAVHKIVAVSPLLMGLCRFLLLILAAIPTELGATGLVVWSALALGCYVTGLSFLATRESRGPPPAAWPCLLFAPPLVLGLIVNRGPYATEAMVLGLILVIWVSFSLSHTFWTEPPNVGWTIRGLLSGIALVDLLSVAHLNWPVLLVFMLLFAGTLLLQRTVPAT